jgi:hypothetical protein
MSTAVPMPLQLIGVSAIGFIGVTIIAVMVGLAVGTLPRQLASMARLPERDAVLLGIAAGLAIAGASALASMIRGAIWARVPALGALNTLVPIVATALEPLTGVMTRIAVATAMFIAIDRWTSGWTRRRAAAAMALALIAFLSGGAPAGSHLGAWAVAGPLQAAAIVAAYITLLRFDLTMMPIALGVTASTAVLARGAGRPYPGAVAGSILAAILITLLAAGWFRALRRVPPTPSVPAV